MAMSNWKNDSNEFVKRAVAIAERTLQRCVENLNETLKENDYEKFIEYLCHANLDFGEYISSYAMPLYFYELRESYEYEGPRGFQEIQSTLKWVNDVANVTRAVDSDCADQTWIALNSLHPPLTKLKHPLRYKYLQAFKACKMLMRNQTIPCPLIPYDFIQDCIDTVNANHKIKEDSFCEDEDFISLIINDVKNNDNHKLYEHLTSSSQHLDLDMLNKGNSWLLLYQLKTYDVINFESLQKGLYEFELSMNKIMAEVDWLVALNTAIEIEDYLTTADILSNLPKINSKNKSAIVLLLIQKKKKLGSSPWLKYNFKDNITIHYNVDCKEFEWGTQNVKSGYVEFEHIYETIDLVEKTNLFCTICKLQAYCKGNLLRKDLEDAKYHSNKQTKEAVLKIEAAYIGYKVRKCVKSIIRNKEYNFKNLKRFLQLVEVPPTDYEREMNLQNMKSEVVRLIRHNGLLEEKVNKLDLTIGLLVQNRISIEQAKAEQKTFGLKGLNIESYQKLVGYQHLFYTLQIYPHYLAKLVFCMPHSQSSKLLQSLIFSLYNFGASPRNEYLLLKLFRFAVIEEIQRYKTPMEALTENPLVMKMAVSYARQTSGQNALRLILEPLIYRMLSEKDLVIDTNPVSIYTSWVNCRESRYGKAIDSPYNMSIEDALKYPEVQKKLQESIDILKVKVDMFLTRIIKMKDVIPYSLRYVANELKTALKSKFPDIPNKDVLKILGRYIYYQFINSAIAAPESFDIIRLEKGAKINSQDRYNLATIAKILQYSAVKKGFGEEAKHLMCLNPFIIECHLKFKDFFEECCQVEDLDKHYSITEFSEFTILYPPIIHISLKEILDTHKMLCEYVTEIAPDEKDPLRELLCDLGDVPTISQLAGRIIDTPSEEQNVGAAVVSITLSNKFTDKMVNNDAVRHFLRAKEVLLILLPFLNENTLAASLRYNSTEEEKNMFSKKYNPETFSSLQSYKREMKQLLQFLSDQGFVTSHDYYQDLFSSLGEDIKNKNVYRNLQRESFEKLSAAKLELEGKTKFFEEQIQYYNNYIEKCLENLNKGQRNIHCVRRTRVNEGLKSNNRLKYTGAKLIEKGVLISVEGLTKSQLKKVVFEIYPAEVNGVFTIFGKFMGKTVETVEVDIQDLLQKQFQSTGVMTLFANVTVNINLLIHLLNEKYYKKS